MIGSRLSVALQIRWLREDLGLTQLQLARKVGVSQQQIAKLENPSANPSLATLEAIAKGAGAVLDVRLVA
jgi:transcriptional regulator with XRE-family HTH domain